MKLPLKSLLCLCLAVPALGLAAPDEGTREEWMTEYRRAASISDTPEMARLISTSQQHAVESVILTCEAISNGSNDQLEADIAGLRKGWAKAMKTAFVDKQYEYYSLLRPEFRKARAKSLEDYNKRSIRYSQAVEAGSKRDLRVLGPEYLLLAEAFQAVGDHYYASQSGLMVGLCMDELNQGPDADFRAAMRGYQICLSEREVAELSDRPYLETKQRFVHLEGLGYGVDDALSNAEEVAKIELGDSFAVPMQFQALESVLEFPRPNYDVDEAYPSWTGLWLGENGTTAAFSAMERDAVRLVRTGASRIDVDTNGDGVGEVEVPTRGKIAVVTCEIGQGPGQRPFAFFAMTGGQRDNYNGIEMNLEGTGPSWTLYVVGAGSMVGTLGETQVQVVDGNLDGVYGSNPKGWGHVGVTEGHYQQDFDSIRVGKEKAARPWSEFIQVGEQWYKLEPKHGGTSLEATPATLNTGTLRLKYKGPQPSYVILKGTESLENSYFDLLQNGKKGVEVPVGRYELFCGLIRQGKRMDITKTIFVPGERTQTWLVGPDDTVDVTLGGPFGFDFKYVAGDSTVTVEGYSVVATGVADERYERPWNCAARPGVSVRKAGAARGGKPEDMPYPSGQGDLDKDWTVAWFPKDLEVSKPKSESIEVQLVQKKHQLFGKLESVWR